MKLEGTNAQQVQGIRELIRGIACNYPAGLAAIKAEVDALVPQAVVESAGLAPTAVWVPRGTSAPTATALETSGSAQVTLEATKRRPGRPKGSKNRSNG